MKEINKYGLSRDIPEQIKRQVRQRCGFGCVICGGIPIHYHHFDPPFKNAKKHNSDGIITLCPTHHQKAESGTLSIDTIKNKINESKSREMGYSHDSLDVSDRFPEIIIGSATYIGNPIILIAFGKPLFFIDYPEAPGAPFRINAKFYNNKGVKACEIVNNEIRFLSSNWDITEAGKEITILQGPREIILKMTIDPPNRLIIDRLNYFYKGYRIIVDEKRKTSVFYPDGTLWFTLGKEKDKEGPVFVGNAAVIVIE